MALRDTLKAVADEKSRPERERLQAAKWLEPLAQFENRMYREITNADPNHRRYSVRLFDYAHFCYSYEAGKLNPAKADINLVYQVQTGLDAYDKIASSPIRIWSKSQARKAIQNIAAAVVADFPEQVKKITEIAEEATSHYPKPPSLCSRIKASFFGAPALAA